MERSCGQRESAWCLVRLVSNWWLEIGADLLTFVALLLAFYLRGQILIRLPVDLITLSVVVDEVTAITILFLVEIGF